MFSGVAAVVAVVFAFLAEWLIWWATRARKAANDEWDRKLAEARRRASN